jgi:hypothetical protein
MHGPINTNNGSIRVLPLSIGINGLKRDIDWADEYKIILDYVRNGSDMF